MPDVGCDAAGCVVWGARDAAVRWVTQVGEINKYSRSAGNPGHGRGVLDLLVVLALLQRLERRAGASPVRVLLVVFRRSHHCGVYLTSRTRRHRLFY